MAPMPRMGQAVKDLIGPPPIPIDRQMVLDVTGYAILVCAPALAIDALARTFLRPTPLLDIAAAVLSSVVLVSFAAGLSAHYTQVREDYQEVGS